MKEVHNQQLFSEFPPVSTSRWEEKIDSDLKGAYRDGKLTWKIPEGFDIKPFYRDEDLESLDYLRNLGFLRPAGEAADPNSWVICQEIFLRKTADLSEAGEWIREATRGGAQAIRIHLDDLHPGKDDLASLLQEVEPGAIMIHFTGHGSTDLLYELLRDHEARTGADPSGPMGSTGDGSAGPKGSTGDSSSGPKGLVREGSSGPKGSIGADPLGRMVGTGAPAEGLDQLGRLVNKAARETPGIRVIEVKGTLMRNAGSSLTEELGMAMAMVNEYIARLSAAGVDPADVVRTLQLELATGPHYFLEIARIRSARILWNTICEAWGIDPAEAKLRIHSTSSTWNMTLYDPYTNMLRGTTEAMAAILGGSDMISVLPFDHPYHPGNSFSGRIARNVQIILREEAFFHRVADPGAGAYYIENLTHSIAERSWEIFREIESMGGFSSAFESGWIQEKVARSRKEKIERATSGRDRILGTNAFPNFNETILGNLGEAFTDQAAASGNYAMQPLVPFRVSAMFEEVRLETERSGKRPKVFLFKHGNPAWAAARATFSGNFFACAGYGIIDPSPAGNPEEAMEAAKQSGAEVVVLCSDDEAYLTIAPGVVEALGNRCLLVVAGYPDSAEELRRSGISYFIHVKSNILESLKEFNRLLLHRTSPEKKTT